MVPLKSGLIRFFLISAMIVPLCMTLSCRQESVMDKTPAASTKYTYTAPSPAPTPVDSRANQYSVTLLDGGSARMGDLLGRNKIVLVNFWATWCGPCRKEIPDLVALQRNLRDKGFEVVGLTVENPQRDQAKVRAFVEQFSINYQIAFAPEEVFMLFNGTDPRAPIPQTFIFDRQGRLVDHIKGFRRDFRAWVEGAVEHALKNS